MPDLELIEFLRTQLKDVVSTLSSIQIQLAELRVRQELAGNVTTRLDKLDERLSSMERDRDQLKGAGMVAGKGAGALWAIVASVATALLTAGAFYLTRR